MSSYHRGPPALVQTGERVLEPSPIALAGGRSALGAEAVERVVGEEFRAKWLLQRGVG